MQAMQDSSDVNSMSSPPPSPGQLLRQAREAKGVHLAVLSVALKMPTRQLEALENDNYEAFKGVTFLRATALMVCRHLELDPAAVLAGLPKTQSPLTVTAPSLEKGPAPQPNARQVGRPLGKGISRSVLLLALLMLVAVLVLNFWPAASDPAAASATEQEQPPLPATEPQDQASEAASAPVTSASSATQEPMAAGSAPSQTAAVPSAPAVASLAQASSARQTPADASASALLIRTTADVWVTVRDNNGQILLRRTVKSGETVSQSVSSPLFVYAGRADATELLMRGKPIDLAGHIQNNEIRIQIKP